MSDTVDTKRAKELVGNALVHVDALVELGMSKGFFMNMVSDYWDTCVRRPRADEPKTAHLRLVKLESECPE